MAVAAATPSSLTCTVVRGETSGVERAWSALRRAMPSASCVVTGLSTYMACGDGVSIWVVAVLLTTPTTRARGAPARVWRRWLNRRPSPGNGHIHHVELRHGAEKTPSRSPRRAAGSAWKLEHHAPRSAAICRVVLGLQKSSPCSIEAQHPGAHGGVFLDRVAVRHDDGAGHAMAARGQPMLWPWLPRVALTTYRGSAPRRASWSK